MIFLDTKGGIPIFYTCTYNRGKPHQPTTQAITPMPIKGKEIACLDRLWTTKPIYPKKAGTRCTAKGWEIINSSLKPLCACYTFSVCSQIFKAPVDWYVM